MKVRQLFSRLLNQIKCLLSELKNVSKMKYSEELRIWSLVIQCCDSFCSAIENRINQGTWKRKLIITKFIAYQRCVQWKKCPLEKAFFYPLIMLSWSKSYRLSIIDKSWSIRLALRLWYHWESLGALEGFTIWNRGHCCFCYHRVTVAERLTSLLCNCKI